MNVLLAHLIEDDGDSVKDFFDLYAAGATQCKKCQADFTSSHGVDRMFSYHRRNPTRLAGRYVGHEFKPEEMYHQPEHKPIGFQDFCGRCNEPIGDVTGEA